MTSSSKKCSQYKYVFFQNKSILINALETFLLKFITFSVAIFHFYVFLNYHMGIKYKVTTRSIVSCSFEMRI